MRGSAADMVDYESEPEPEGTQYIQQLTSQMSITIFDVYHNIQKIITSKIKCDKNKCTMAQCVSPIYIYTTNITPKIHQPRKPQISSTTE